MTETAYRILEVPVTEREFLHLSELANSEAWKDFEVLLERVRDFNRCQLESADTSERDTQLLRGDCRRVNRLLNLRSTILAANRQAKGKP